jgi:hypothetical protein
MIVDLSWSEFKSKVVNKKSVRYVDRDSFYLISYGNGGAQFQTSILKDSGSDQNDFETNYKDLANSIIIDEVVTQFEKNDKTLKMCGDKGTIDNTTKKYQMKFLVPGTPNSTDCRFVSGGMAWVHPYSSTARVRVFITDEDNILGYGSGAIIASYTDTEQPESKRCWYFPPIGHVEAETLGGYGDIPAGLYLLIEFEDDAGGGVAYCNLEWGKLE